jgi:hypothetical protein
VCPSGPRVCYPTVPSPSRRRASFIASLCDPDSASHKMALTGPHYAAALTEVLPVGDALPRVHLPPAGLTALGLSSGSVALLALADAVTSESAAVAVFIAVQPTKLRPGEIAANAPALDSLRACGHAVGIGTPLRVHSGRSTIEQLQAACALVTLRLLPAPQPEPAQQSTAAGDTTTGELEDALRRTTLSTPPSSSKGKARDRGASTPTASASPAAARQQSGTGSRVSALRCVSCALQRVYALCRSSHVSLSLYQCRLDSTRYGRQRFVAAPGSTCMQTYEWPPYSYRLHHAAVLAWQSSACRHRGCRAARWAKDCPAWHSVRVHSLCARALGRMGRARRRPDFRLTAAPPNIGRGRHS